ncbi:MAG: hypothetical protein HZA19_04625 [Nitrospirae bacterium]|nr:hypothetical protein [Nitrospirota bacterium]
MKFSTAFTISGICLAALLGELILTYFIFTNYALTLAETGQYGNIRGAYKTGPLAGVAKIFYGIFLVTAAIAIVAPVMALVTMLIRGRSKGHS